MNETQMKCLFKDLLVSEGEIRRCDQAIEECSELILALSHYKRGRATVKDVLSEMADVYMMIRSLEAVFGDCQGVVESKMAMLE